MSVRNKVKARMCLRSVLIYLISIGADEESKRVVSELYWQV